jgi:hypothetical protein
MRRLLVALAALLSACGDTYIIQGGWPDGGSAVADGSVADAAVPVFDARVPDARVAPDARVPDAALPSDARLPDAAPPEQANCGHTTQNCCNFVNAPGDMCTGQTNCCYGASMACVGSGGTCEHCGALNENCCPNVTVECGPGLMCSFQAPTPPQGNPICTSQG